MTARERRKQRKHRGRERTGSLKLFVTLSYVRLARARRSFLELHVSSSDAHLISFLDWKVTYLLIVISAVFVYQILECRRNIHFFLSSNLFSRYGCRCGDIHWLRDEECYEHVKSRDKGRDDNRELKVPLTPPIFFPCFPIWRWFRRHSRCDEGRICRLVDYEEPMPDQILSLVSSGSVSWVADYDL